MVKEDEESLGERRCATGLTAIYALDIWSQRDMWMEMVALVVLMNQKSLCLPKGAKVVIAVLPRMESPLLMKGDSRDHSRSRMATFVASAGSSVIVHRSISLLIGPSTRGFVSRQTFESIKSLLSVYATIVSHRLMLLLDACLSRSVVVRINIWFMVKASLGLTNSLTSYD